VPKPESGIAPIPPVNSWKDGVWRNGAFDPFPGSFSGSAISDDARAVAGGVQSEADFLFTEFLWNNGALIPLTSAGEESAIAGPQGLSANGQVIAVWVKLAGQPQERVFRGEGGGQDTAWAAAGYHASMALTVTADESAMTGHSFNTLTGNRRGFVWSGG